MIHTQSPTFFDYTYNEGTISLSAGAVMLAGIHRDALIKPYDAWYEPITQIIKVASSTVLAALATVVSVIAFARLAVETLFLALAAPFTGGELLKGNLVLTGMAMVASLVSAIEIVALPASFAIGLLTRPIATILADNEADNSDSASVSVCQLS